MSTRQREMDLPARMSEHEALMWNIEKDPWLNPSGGSLTLLDRELDFEHFQQVLRSGVANTPRLYQRVVPGFARLSTPAWAVDTEFDLDAHLRQIALPSPGSERQLLDLATQLYSEPLDRTRPLWRFVVINGVEGGRGAIFAIIHHSVSDGIGQMRMAEMYQQFSRDLTPPPEVDLDGIIAEAAANEAAKESGGNVASSALGPIQQSVGHQVRRQLGIGRRVAAELAMWPADPSRAGEQASKVVASVRSAVSTIGPSDDGDRAGSPLLAERSRHRHLEWVRLDLDDLKAVRAAFGGTVNDVFLAGMAEAVHRYHVARDTSIESASSSFVVSTRTDKKAGGNAFTPVPVALPAGKMSIRKRVQATVDVVESAKEETKKSGGMTAMSGVINLLPISVVTQTARSAAQHIDFATSNLRGAPFPLYCSGAKVEATIAMGPVAGTGANVTAMSYDGDFDIGLFLDPAAYTDPEGFRDAVESSFADMVADAKKRAKAKKKSTKPKKEKKSLGSKGGI
ncbi:MAG: wax ester/triacylglycerol synthase domain-containing protein [Actinomycetota bacterium]